MPRRSFVCALCAFTVLSLLAACPQTDNATLNVAERRPFSLDIHGGDGTAVSLDACSDGYRPGTMKTMQLAIKNNTDQPWEGRWCIELLEPLPSIVVVPLSEEEFDIELGGGFERDVRIDLPADLSPGIYGLTLVVHEPTGPFVSVTPVQVGEGEREPFQGKWPTVAALEACPAP